jgi:hypothetical protein
MDPWATPSNAHAMVSSLKVILNCPLLSEHSALLYLFAATEMALTL